MASGPNMCWARASGSEGTLMRVPCDQHAIDSTMLATHSKPLDVVQKLVL